MKKLTLILGLLLSNLANAATYASGVVPFNGTYNLEISHSCALDVSYANSLPPITSYNEVLVGSNNFMPDTAHTSTVSSIDAYNKWLAYVAPLTGVSAPVLSQVVDPTSASVPPAKLIETPLQWGIIKQSTIQSDVTFPYTVVPTTTNYIESAYSVLTKYTYSNSALTNGVTTGYAIYRQNNIGTPWVRLQIFTNAFSATSLSASTNVILLAHHSEQKLIGSQNYIFNCGSKINMIR